MKPEIREFLEHVQKTELKWMYGLDTDDEMFGVETYLYSLCVLVLQESIDLKSFMATVAYEYGTDFYVYRELDKLLK